MSASIREAAQLLRYLSTRDPQRCADLLASMPEGSLEDIANSWQLHARFKQIRPLDCRQFWVLGGGRGSGKNRAASEETLDKCEDWGPAMNGAILSKTVGDVRDSMIEGISGLQACAQRRGYSVRYVSNKSLVEHPSGAKLHVMSAESPEFGRGPNLNYFWADEVSAWPKNSLERFKSFLFAVRIRAPTADRKPLGIITMTPRPNEITRYILRDPLMALKCTIVTESSYANRANISSDVFELFEGSRLGRQELEGVLLDDENAIIDLDTIHRFRVHDAPENLRKVLSLDPSITAGEDSDAAGVVVVGSLQREAFMLADYTCNAAKFSDWARQAVVAAWLHDCEAIVAEVNQGGGGIVEAIETALAQLSEEVGREIVIPVRSIWAKLSKKARAEPVGVLYERGRMHHVGHFPALEKELSEWVPGAKSPNRMDAVVHGVTHLIFGDRRHPGIESLYAA